MPTYKAKLSDGRLVTLESDTQPTEDQILQAVSSYKSTEQSGEVPEDFVPELPKFTPSPEAVARAKEMGGEMGEDVLPLGAHPMETVNKLIGTAASAVGNTLIKPFRGNPTHFELQFGNPNPRPIEPIPDEPYFQAGKPIINFKKTQLQPEGNAITKLIEGLSTPEMVATFPFAAAKPVQAYFLTQTVPGAIEAAKKLVDKNTPEDERSDAATELLINGLMSYGMARHMGKTKGGPDASSQPEAAEVHGNVRAQPEPAEVVPTEEGSPGVQPQAEVGVPEAKQGEVLLNKDNPYQSIMEEDGSWSVVAPDGSVVDTVGDIYKARNLANELHEKSKSSAKEVKLAPVEYLGYQPGFQHIPGQHQYNLTESIPGTKFSKGSTVSRRALEESGFTIPEEQAALESKSASESVTTAKIPEADQLILDEQHKASGIKFPVELVDPSVIDPDKVPFSRSLNGALFTIDPEGGRIIGNSELIPKWIKSMRDDGFNDAKIGKAVRAMLEQERIHMHTSPADARAYWGTLTGIEKLAENRIYQRRWGNVDNLSDAQRGWEATRRRMEQLAGMTPSEVAEAAGAEKWKLKSIIALEGAVRSVREKLGTDASKEALAILDRIKENLNIVKIVANGGNPASFSRRTKDEKNQPVFDALVNASKFEQMRLAASGSKIAAEQAAKSNFRNAEADAGQAPLMAGDFPQARTGRPIKRSEDVRKQETMDFAKAAVNPIENPEVPSGERTSAEAAGALPHLTGADLEARASQWMDETFKKTSEKAVKSVKMVKQKFQTEGGEGEQRMPVKSFLTPKFEDFSDFINRQMPGVKPGQLQEMWQKAVFDRLEKATDEEIRSLVEAEFGSATSKGVEPWQVKMARQPLTYEPHGQPPEQIGLFPGVSVKEGKYREPSPNPKVVPIDPNTGKMMRAPRDLAEEASTRQETKEERDAPKRRLRVIAQLYKAMVTQPKNMAVLERGSVGPEDIRYGGGTDISSVQNFSPRDAVQPKILGHELTDEARRSADDPVTATKRLTVIMDKSNGEVHLVSTYRHPTGETMLVDPVSPQRQHVPLESILRRYRVLQSVLLDEPVQKFKQSYKSMEEYNDKFGSAAKEQYAAESNYHTPPVAEYMDTLEGTPGLEGEGGHLQGPFRAGIEAVTGGAEGSLEKGRYVPITPPEAVAMVNHIVKHQGTFETPGDVLEAMTALGTEKNRQAISGFSKVARAMQRKFPDLDTESLLQEMAKQIYEDHTQSKSLEEFIARASAAGRPKVGEAVRPEVQAKQSKTARELTMPLERRAPTDVRPENLPPYAPPSQNFRIIVPKPTAEPGRVSSPDMLSPEDAQWVNYMALQPEFHSELAEQMRKGPPMRLEEMKPYEEQKLLKEKSPMATTYRKFKERADDAADELDRRRRQLTSKWLRSATNKIIKQTADGMDNVAALTGENVRLSLKNVSKEEIVRSSPMALISTGKIGENPNTGKRFFFYDRSEIDSKIGKAQLGQIKADDVLNDPKSTRQDKAHAKRWKAAAQKLETIALYVRDHWGDKKMLEMAGQVRQELYDQLLREHQGGVSTTDFGEYYFPNRYEGEMFNLDSITFGDDSTIGKRFSSKKKFRDHYDAISTGPFVPKSYDAADIVGHRVRQGMKSVVRASWAETLKDMKDTDASGMPLAKSAVPTNPRRLVDPDTGEQDFLPGKWEAPSPEYELVYPSHSADPVAVLKPYAPLVRLMTARSGFEGSSIGEGALYFTSMLKHGVVLIADTFHPFRLGQYAMSLMGSEAGFRRGFASLMYRAEDLPEAVAQGYISPEAAKWATAKVSVKTKGGWVSMTKQEILRDGVSKGLNAAKISDALYKDAVERIPIIGKTLYHGIGGYGLGKFNNFVFGKFLPGLISESYVRNVEKLHAKHPDVPFDKLSRDVVTDMNTFYGNMGRQGVFANPTIRDAAQVLFLAPMWQEGLIGKELRFYGRLTGISNLTGRRGLPQMGALGSGILKGLGAYFVLTQAINLVTRGQTTFQNMEKGHQLDAWIPTGKETGVWLSPMSVFAETMHDIIRLFETKPKAWDGIVQIGENKLGPMGKLANVLHTSRSPQGEYLTTTGAVLKEAARQVAPVPISLGKPLAWAGYAAGLNAKPEPGTTARQVFSAVGIKTEVGRDAISQVSKAANDFALKNGLKPDVAVIVATDEPSYAKLRHSLKIGDEGSAGKMMQELRKTHSDAEIIQAMKEWTRRPFTGSDKAERLWLHEMNEDQMAVYTKANQQKMDLWNGFVDWYLRQQGK